MDSQSEQQQSAAAARQVTPDSPSRPRGSERRSSHSSLRLEEDIDEAIMPSYKNLGRQTKAQTNRAAATQTPQDQFTCPNTQLQSYLTELENRRQLCAQQNGGRLDLGTAEILNTIGLHYHHVTHDHESALACHQEALGVLQQIQADLLGPTSPRSSSGGVSSAVSSTAADVDEPPPLPGSTVLTEEQNAHLNEVYVQTAITLTDIGNAYKSTGASESALRAYNEALDIFRKLGMKEGHPRVEATLRCVKRIDQRFEAGTGVLPSYHHSNS